MKLNLAALPKEPSELLPREEFWRLFSSSVGPVWNAEIGSPEEIAQAERDRRAKFDGWYDAVSLRQQELREAWARRPIVRLHRWMTRWWAEQVGGG